MHLFSKLILIVGRLGRAAVLTAVTVEFKRFYSVVAGDLLLSVNGVATSLLSSSDLENILCAGFALVSFEVVGKLTYDENNNAAATAMARPQIQSKEQLSLNRHGFYAKGNYYS